MNAGRQGGSLYVRPELPYLSRSGKGCHISAGVLSISSIKGEFGDISASKDELAPTVKLLQQTLTTTATETARFRRNTDDFRRPSSVEHRGSLKVIRMAAVRRSHVSGHLACVHGELSRINVRQALKSLFKRHSITTDVQQDDAFLWATEKDMTYTVVIAIMRLIEKEKNASFS